MRIRLYKFSSDKPRYDRSFEIAETVNMSDDDELIAALRPALEEIFGGRVRIDLWISPTAIYQNVPGSNPAISTQVGYLDW